MKKISVQCRGIRLAYGRNEVLKDVDVDVRPGEFFALLGPSGSGKSTLLRVIAGFNQHQQGQLLIDGLDLTGTAPWQRNIGMVFQSYALWPHMTVWDNVAFGLVERRVPRDALARKVEAALALVGLQDLAKRRPGQLSGGQQQRVALARTLVIEPQVLLLDEPLSNLDKSLRVQMRQELLALQRRLGITTIFVTHEQEEAMTTADRMAVLDKGVVQQVGTPTELFDFPANEFVAGFVGTMNLLRGTVRARKERGLTLDIDGVGDIEVPMDGRPPAGDRAVLSVRPHVLHIHAASDIADPRLFWMNGVVASSEFLGESTRYQVRVGSQLVAVDQPHHAGLRKFSPGSKVGVGLERSQARMLPA